MHICASAHTHTNILSDLSNDEIVLHKLMKTHIPTVSVYACSCRQESTHLYASQYNQNNC